MKAVLFDVDGVLIDNRKYEEKNLEYIFNFMSKKMRISYDEAKNRFWAVTKDHRNKKEWHDWRIYCEKLGLGDVWREAHIKNVDYLKIMDGAKELLERLHKRCQLVIASDAIRDVVEIKLKHLKLIDFFDLIVSQDEAGEIKRDTKFFTYILKRLHLDPEDCFCVDNRLDRGIVTAKKLGITTIYIPFKEHSQDFTHEDSDAKPDFIVNELKDIYKIIEKHIS